MSDKKKPQLYAYVTILAPVDRSDGAPTEWFKGVPKGAYYVVNILKSANSDTLRDDAKWAGVAMVRKVESDGLPA